MAPVTVMGHEVYGVFIEPGMGLRELGGQRQALQRWLLL
jgi:hypothetical protein